MSNISLNAQSRSDMGKGASRRLRRQEQVPAIIYGAEKEPKTIMLAHNEVKKAMENEEFYSQILDLNIDGKKEQAVLKDVQRHPYKPIINHMDFLRIKANEKVNMPISLHFLNEDVAIGVKQQGGVVSHTMSEVEVRCLPADLPKFIEVDVANLELDHSLHLSELKLPKGVELVALAHGDQAVVAVHKTRAATEDEAPTEETAEAAEPTPTAEKSE